MYVFQILKSIPNLRQDLTKIESCVRPPIMVSMWNLIGIAADIDIRNCQILFSLIQKYDNYCVLLSIQLLVLPSVSAILVK